MATLTKMTLEEVRKLRAGRPTKTSLRRYRQTIKVSFRLSAEEARLLGELRAATGLNTSQLMRAFVRSAHAELKQKEAAA